MLQRFSSSEGSCGRTFHCATRCVPMPCVRTASTGYLGSVTIRTIRADIIRLHCATHMGHLSTANARGDTIAGAAALRPCAGPAPCRLHGADPKVAACGQRPSGKASRSRSWCRWAGVCMARPALGSGGLTSVCAGTRARASHGHSAAHSAIRILMTSIRVLTMRQTSRATRCASARARGPVKGFTPSSLRTASWWRYSERWASG